MIARSFVDTNLLLYAHAPEPASKREIAKGLLQELWVESAGVISTQVLQEFYVNLTRNTSILVSPAIARDLAAKYAQWDVAIIEPADVLAATRLEQDARINFWDALIVVAAAKSGAERILSEDINPGQRLLGVRIENPFLASYAD